MSSASFSLESHLDGIYAEAPRHFALTARTLPEYLIWQSTFRGELLHLLNLEDRLPPPLTVEKLGSIDRTAYSEEKVALDTIFPLACALEQFEIVRRAYEINNKSHACQLRTHPGGHAYNHLLSQSWFQMWM